MTKNKSFESQRIGRDEFNSNFFIESYSNIKTINRTRTRQIEYPHCHRENLPPHTLVVSLNSKS